MSTEDRMSPEEEAWIERLNADRPAGGVPVSAEERPAALLHAFAIGCDGPGHDHTDDARDLIAAGVSVPTEPGARPTHLRGVLPPIDLDGIEMRWASQWNESDDGEVRAWRDDVAALIDEVRRLSREIGPRFAICGVIWPGGPNGEPLACAWPPNPPDQPMHEHSWSWVPTPGVPTEPGAPGHAHSAVTIRELYCFEAGVEEGKRLASRPVPAPEPSAELTMAERRRMTDIALGRAPEPSARLREAVVAYLAALDRPHPGGPDDMTEDAAEQALRAALAATPQDPEETR